MATQEKSKHSLVSLMRGLRKLLPEDTKKVDITQYLVCGKVFVILNYYCRWGNRKENETYEMAKMRMQKECNPHSVTVAISLEYVEKQTKRRPRASAVHTTRTLCKRKDGSISLESVATAVTKALESIDSYIAKCANEDKINKIKKEAREKELERIGNLLPKCFEAHGYYGYEYKSEQLGSVDISLHRNQELPQEEDSPTPIYKYRFLVDTLSAEQILSIISLLGVKDANN